MTDLFDKVYGCIAGAFVSSAMGAAVEGWEWRDIRVKYGVLQELLPCAHYKNLGKRGSGRVRPPGTTEDGVERLRLLILAIGEKQGRISAEDLGKTWLKYIVPENFGVQMEPCDEILYKVVASGVHPSYAGLYSDFTGIVSFARQLANPVFSFRDNTSIATWGNLSETSQTQQSSGQTLNLASNIQATRRMLYFEHVR